MKRLRVIALAGLLGYATLLGTYTLADRALPPDLSRLDDLSLVLEDRDGRLLHVTPTNAGRYRLPVSVADVDRRYIDMLITYEDKRFYDHSGIDPLALARAFGQWVAAGRVVSGGSTLTMQTARLLEPRPRNIWAKFAEMFRALQLENRYSKDEILEMYMTLAPFGGRVDGLRAASLAYFGKEPRYLTDSQAALLVALPQAPSRLRPDRHPEQATAARGKVLTRIGLDYTEDSVGPVPNRQRLFPHLVRQLAEDRRGETGTIRTTLDLYVQKGVTNLAARVIQSQPAPVNAAVIVVENATRSIVAHVGNAAPLDEARYGYLNLTTASRSPGSTLKPFIYAMAFDANLLHPKTVIADHKTRFGDYTPQNFDRAQRGVVTATQALRLSLNIPAIKVLDRLGPVRFISALKANGVALDLPNSEHRPSLAVGLGGIGVDLETLVRLYAALASDGRYCTLVTEVGQTPDCPNGEAQMISTQSRHWLYSILAGAPRPVGWSADQGGRASAPVAFKTGTSYGYRDKWAVGFDERYTVGVWIGRPDGAPMTGGTGLSTAAPLLLAVFDHLPRLQKSTSYAAITPIGDVPPALQKFDAKIAASDPTAAFANSIPGPRLAFPPDGARMLWDDIKTHGLSLKAHGGQRPLSWMVNGRPTAIGSWQRSLNWKPDGPGTYHLTVIDRDGKSSAATVVVRQTIAQ